MGANSAIEWTDHTFNPWIGCTRVSDGQRPSACDFCYAADMAHRWGWAEWGAGQPRQRTGAANWRKPLAWDRDAKAAGVRRRVFCASLADVFDAEVPDAWRDELFAMVIMATPHLDWLLLTKRPQVAKKWFAEHPAPPNVWLGTTVEDQAMADLRLADDRRPEVRRTDPGQGQAGLLGVAAVIRPPMWYDDFDCELYKIVPDAERIISPVAAIELETTGQRDVRTGRLNHPTCWNGDTGMISFFARVKDGRAIWQRPSFYYTSAPPIRCTVEEAVRDVFVHHLQMGVDGQLVFDAGRLWKPFETLLWATRKWREVDGAEIVAARRAVLQEVIKAVGRMQKMEGAD